MRNKNTKKINYKVTENQLINYLEMAVGDEMILNSFIRGIKIVSFDDKNIVFYIDSKEKKEFIEKECLGIFKKAIKDVLNLNLNIEFVLQVNDFSKEKQKKSYINKKFTFDNYVISSFNNDVVQIAKKIIKELGKFSPFYVYSESGLGKTHLLHAIGNKLIKNKKNVLYVEPNRFTDNIRVLSKKSGGISDFIESLKHVDAILFDDIQIMGDRTTTLKVLFQLINHFVENEKQIVIASDVVANKLSGFESRYITRFESGISEKIKNLKIEDVSKILLKKLKDEDLDPDKWEKEAINFIARNNTSSIRVLEGAIKRISFYMENKTNIKYTHSIVSNIFKNLEVDKFELTPSRIISVIASYYKINKSDITGKSRKKEFIFPRHLSIYLVRQITNLSQTQIGKLFGNRDHSTVINAIKNIDKKIKIDKASKLVLKTIERKIKTIS